MDCQCGGRHTTSNKLQHLKTKRHQNWLDHEHNKKIADKLYLPRTKKLLYTCACGKLLINKQFNIKKHLETKKHQALMLIINSCKPSDTETELDYFSDDDEDNIYNI